MLCENLWLLKSLSIEGYYPSVTTNQKYHHMTKSSVLFCGALFTFAAVQCTNAQVIADWTFETSQPGVVTLPAAPGAGVAFTSFSPEVGSGTASALHATAATYSSPAGNGSAHSFSANNWTVGDYFQFQVSTLGFTGISVSYDQISSGTGPAQFKLQYSTDGSTFSTFGSPYTVIANTSPNNWSSGTPIFTSSYSFDLSSITAIDNAANVYFRLVNDGTTSANGGTVASGGTDRVDNFTVSVNPVPEPTTLALVAFGGMSALLAFRKRS